MFHISIPKMGPHMIAVCTIRIDTTAVSEFPVFYDICGKWMPGFSNLCVNSHVKHRRLSSLYQFGFTNIWLHLSQTVYSEQKSSVALNCHDTYHHSLNSMWIVRVMSFRSIVKTRNQNKSDQSFFISNIFLTKKLPFISKAWMCVQKLFAEKVR